MRRFDSVESALTVLARGGAVIVVDEENRENEGDLVFAAESASPALLAFMVRHTSGFVCVALEEQDADRLALPPMVRDNQDRHGTAYTVTVDAREGITTGISARDRARTIALLAAPTTTPLDLNRPGHVVPLRARPGGVLERRGHTEATVDLMRAAGLRPAGVLCEIVSADEPTRMARLPELTAFADVHGLPLICIADIVRYRRGRLVTPDGSAPLQVAAGAFDARRYRGIGDGREHLALVHGDPAGFGAGVPVRIHRECTAGAALGALYCHCREELDDAYSAITGHGAGVVVYLRSGTPDDSAWVSAEDRADCPGAPGAHDMAIAAQILGDLGVSSVRLLGGGTEIDLHGHGIEVIPDVPAEPSAEVPRAPDVIATVIGTVVHGDARGRELGFPTANLEIRTDRCHLPDGVYGGLARTLQADGHAEAYRVAAISVGSNPTFPGVGQRFEVHLLDFCDDLYGSTLEVLPLTFIRPTLLFESVEALTAQIAGDVREIRRLSATDPAAVARANGAV